MASNDLYTLAFAYKKEKLWKKMFDSEIFACRLPDGEIGYCCVMGLMGDHVALAVYVGAEGWTSYRTIADASETMMNFDPFIEGQLPFSFDESNFHNWMFSQSCLQCSFENRDELSDEEVEEVREAARACGVNLRGPRAFPQFMKYIPNRFPWHFQSEEDEKRMWAALSAALSLAAVLKNTSKWELGLVPVDSSTKDVLFLEWENDGWTFSRTDLPEPLPPSFPSPGELDKASAARLRKLKKRGIMECELIYLTQPVQDNPDEPPTFPVMLLCVDTKTGNLMPVEPVSNYNDDPDSLRDAFVRALTASGSCPRALKVRNESTRAILEDLCMKAGILLSMDEDLPALDDAKEEFFSLMEDNEDSDPEEMFDQLMDLTDDELCQLPQLLADSLLQMADMGMLPPELELRLRNLFE